MVAEQTIHTRFWTSLHQSSRDVHLDARVETPGEEGVDVDTVLLYEPALSTAWNDEIVRRIHEGVHAGIAAVGVPLPTGGIRVVIRTLAVSPALAVDPTTAELAAVGETIRAQVAATIETLWAGLSRQSAGSEGAAFRPRR